MCEAAVTLASTGQAEAIIAVTHYGKTAQLLSSLRPRATILAVTPSDIVARRLTLYWGVRPVVSDLEDLRALEQPIRSAIALSPRAVVVFVNINPDLSRVDANFLNVSGGLTTQLTKKSHSTLIAIYNLQCRVLDHR